MKQIVLERDGNNAFIVEVAGPNNTTVKKSLKEHNATIAKAVDELYAARLKGLNDARKNPSGQRKLALKDEAALNLNPTQDRDKIELVQNYKKLLNGKSVDDFNSDRTKDLEKLAPFSIHSLDEQTGFKRPSAWRGLSVIAEGEVLWFIDWFSIGPKVGISGDLFKLVSNDNPDLSTATQFSIKAGVTMGFSKWFSLDLLLSLMRCTLNKNKTADTAETQALKEFKELHTEFNTNVPNVLTSTADAQKWAQAIKDVDSQKSLEDRYNFGGWAWGAAIRASFNFWITEFLALKVGAELSLPFTDVSGKDSTDNTVSFRPSQKLSPYVGLVLAIG